MIEPPTSTDYIVSNIGRDIRPSVASDSSNRPLWFGLSAIGVVGLILFLVLDANRRAGVTPAVRPSASELAIAPPTEQPQLFVPPDAQNLSPIYSFADTRRPANLRTQVPVRASTPAQSSVSVREVATAPRSAASEQFWKPEASLPLSTPAPTTAESSEPVSAIIVDGGIVANTKGITETPPRAAAASQSELGAAIAVRPPTASTGARALIIPQGTLISAVLETGLDSTQPGQARALVSADIRANRSTRVLIPKGSRLFGSYQGELASGQNRVLVQWARLVRPDGVTIPIDSPASDRLGRAGIKGKVRTYFWQRLGGALLQSTIDIGSILASRGGSGSTVLVTVPGRVSSVASELVGTAPKPSISVRPGTQISVFVVRDLDFSEVEGLP